MLWVIEIRKAMKVWWVIGHVLYLKSHESIMGDRSSFLLTNWALGATIKPVGLLFWLVINDLYLISPGTQRKAIRHFGNWIEFSTTTKFKTSMSDAYKMVENEHFENASIKPFGPLFLTLVMKMKILWCSEKRTYLGS